MMGTFLPHLRKLKTLGLKPRCNALTTNRPLIQEFSTLAGNGVQKHAKNFTKFSTLAGNGGKKGPIAQYQTLQKLGKMSHVLVYGGVTVSGVGLLGYWWWISLVEKPENEKGLEKEEDKKGVEVEKEEDKKGVEKEEDKKGVEKAKDVKEEEEEEAEAEVCIEVYVNADAAGQLENYNDYVFWVAAVVRTPEGVPIMASITLLKNPSIKDDERNLLEIRKMFVKLLTKRETIKLDTIHRDLKKSKEELNAIMYRKEISPKNYAKLSEMMAMVEKEETKTKALKLLDTTRTELERILSNMYGERRAYLDTMEAELVGIYKGLLLVDDETSILSLKSDNKDSVKLVLKHLDQLNIEKKRSLNKKEKKLLLEPEGLANHEARLRRLNELAVSIINKLMMKKKSVPVEFTDRERNKLADRFAKYGKKIIDHKVHPSDFTLFLDRKQIEEIKDEKLRKIMKAEKDDTSLWK